MNTRKQGHCTTLDDCKNARLWFFHCCGFRCCVSFMCWRCLQLRQLTMTTNLGFLLNGQCNSKSKKEKSVRKRLRVAILDQNSVSLVWLTWIRDWVDPHAFGALLLAFFAPSTLLTRWLRLISFPQNDATWIWIRWAFTFPQHCKCFGDCSSLGQCIWPSNCCSYRHWPWISFRFCIICDLTQAKFIIYVINQFEWARSHSRYLELNGQQIDLTLNTYNERTKH